MPSVCLCHEGSHRLKGRTLKCYKPSQEQAVQGVIVCYCSTQLGVEWWFGFLESHLNVECSFWRF